MCCSGAASASEEEEGVVVAMIVVAVVVVEGRAGAGAGACLLSWACWRGTAIWLRSMVCCRGLASALSFTGTQRRRQSSQGRRGSVLGCTVHPKGPLHQEALGNRSL